MESAPHNLVIQRARNVLASMLDDPFLTDVSAACSVEEVQSQLALLQGRAVTIHVRRFDGHLICELMALAVCSIETPMTLNVQL